MITPHELASREIETNLIAGTRLIPWVHDNVNDLVSTILRIHDARNTAASMVLSIDSIRPSDLILSDIKSVDEVLGQTHVYQSVILENVTNAGKTILIGSDPLSFMILSSNNSSVDAIGTYAGIIAAMALGASVSEASLRYITKEKTNLYMTRRDMLRLLFIGTAATASGLASRLLPSTSQKDRVKEAANLDKGIGVGIPGQYSQAQGVDERTLLDSLKHRKAIEYLQQIGHIISDVASISVWGNDHFLTDDFNLLARIAQEQDAAKKYIERGEAWLETVLPEARKLLSNEGHPDSVIDDFAAKAYFDLRSITLVNLTTIDGQRYLEPIVVGNSNAINLLD